MDTLSRMDAIKAVTKLNHSLAGKVLPIVLETLDKDKNLVMTPYSICSTMVMLHAGAGGETAKDIEYQLGFPEELKLLQLGCQDVNDSFGQESPRSGAAAKCFDVCGKIFPMCFKNESDFSLDIASQIFVRQGCNLKPSYLDLLEKTFQTTVSTLDFSKSEESREFINKWAESKTHGRVKDSIKSSTLDAQTSLILFNAVSFKGKWGTQFNRSSTAKKEFTISESQPAVMVDMMTIWSMFPLEPIAALGCRVLRMPYEGDQMDMLFFLSDSADGFGYMEKLLPTFDLSDLRLDDWNEVEVFIPKFKLTTEHTDLVQILQKVGITKIFEKEVADFSEMAEPGPGPLFVSNIIQEAIIEVSEEGSPAVPVTTEPNEEEGEPGDVPVEQTPTFNCNRPFLFVVWDRNTDLKIFTGRVMNPKSE